MPHGALIILAGFVLAGAAAFASAAEPPEFPTQVLAKREAIATDLRSQFDRAQHVLDRAVAAAGGGAAIRALRTVSFELDGVGANGLQGRTPEELFNPRPEGMVRISSHYDFQNDRYIEETWQEITGRFLLHYGALYKAGAFYNLSYNEAEFWKLEGAAAGATSGSVTDATSQFVPILLLRKALEARRSVIWVGEKAFEGTTFDVLDFSWDAATRHRLLISRQDGTLAFMQTLNPDPILAEDAHTYIYTGSQLSEGVRFPMRVVLRRRGSLAFDLALRNVQVNAALEESAFNVPANLTEASPPLQLVTKRIRGDIYEISGVGSGWYRVQFIDRPEYAVVLDAMLGYGASKAIIREIRRTIGDKPIRYVVISHHHGDHTAGIRAFVEEGSTIVTTKANEPLLRAMARTVSTAASSSTIPAEPKFMFVSDRLALDRGQDAPQVFKMAETPHARDMQVLYDPRNRIVIAGDSYSRLVAFNDTFLIFADWLRKTKLDADLLLGSHHQPIPKDRFLEAADTYRRERARTAKADATGR